MNGVIHLYKKEGAQYFGGCQEICFNIGFSEPLNEAEIDNLRLVLADGFIKKSVTLSSVLRIEANSKKIVEVGPRMNFATAWSSNMISICRAIGLEKVVRVERSRLYVVPEGADEKQFVADHHDRMTECQYLETLTTFETGLVPEEVYEVDMMSGGPDALKNIPGISMDKHDRQMYHDYFVVQEGRNPTIVEIMDLNNANSEHSRHGFFRGRMVIDGEEMPETLMDVVKSTLEANPRGSIIAFKDNSSGIKGRFVQTIVPEKPGYSSPFVHDAVFLNPIFTAETHNFPTGIAPVPGAETGTGGRIRDIQATGKGGFVIAGTAGYCFGNLMIPDYDLPWEEESKRPADLASPLQIAIGASNGASDYGNKFGEPVVAGFVNSFDLRLANGERWGFLKPIMFTGGIGQIRSEHIEKAEAENGWKIVQVGGPAYRVGFGGGAASSKMQGDEDSELNFRAVQRGDGEMEQKMNRVIRACCEMGEYSLIEVAHDQGAGGPGNVLKELVEKSGGRIDIRKIKVGDPTMSVLEIYVAEYQERNGLLIRSENIDQFQAICEREKVNCEVLGEVTGDGHFVVFDSQDGTTPVDMDLGQLLGNIPQKTFSDSHSKSKLAPLVLPEVPIKDMLNRVLALPSIGSKRFLTNKVDRSVSGRIAAQQCCGPLQLTVGNVAVVADSHFRNELGLFSGAATAIGEQPAKLLVNPKAGARMAVGEALTNLVWAKIDGLDIVKCSANWMWAPKLPGEGAALYDAASAMRDVMITLGIAVDGGKDSLSMATRVGDEIVKSPRQLVISAYATMADVTKVVTPDIKKPGESVLFFIDLAKRKNRLGGSALAQVYGQIGDESPDVDDPELLKECFNVIQSILDEGLILAGHDRSGGGLITTLLEMAFAGNCGIEAGLVSASNAQEFLFSEELGLVVEVENDKLPVFVEALSAEVAQHTFEIGRTMEEKRIYVSFNSKAVLDENMEDLRGQWEETSYQLERLQADPSCAFDESHNIFRRSGPKYFLPEGMDLSLKDIDASSILSEKPKVAILREEGSNSDREMTSSFFDAGFEPWDVTMTDLLSGKISLNKFRGLAAVGGFSYADVPDSAKGWAATIMFNDGLRKMFDTFYDRKDTFSLGICNGCQLFGLLGWVPWRKIDPEAQPRFVHNVSGRFESRWATVKVLESNAMMLKGMEGLTFGIHVAHGEGRLHFPEPAIKDILWSDGLVSVVYVDDRGNQTEDYPFNPNGSPDGITGLCSPDGRHLAMMPHPERSFLSWQCHYLPEGMKQELHEAGGAPWLQMFKNAYQWCMKN